jgi:ubiquinone biosynthesis protein Coq4
VHWNSPQTYIDIIGSEAVSIAITEDGLADSVQTLSDASGKEVFVKPLNEEMALEDFMNRLGKSYASP